MGVDSNRVWIMGLSFKKVLQTVHKVVRFTTQVLTVLPFIRICQDGSFQ